MLLSVIVTTGTVFVVITDLISWIYAFRFSIFLLYFSIATFVLLYCSIKISFSAVTPSSLSDRDLAWACSFYLSCINYSRFKVFFKRSFYIASLYLFNCFLFERSSFRCFVSSWNLSFYSLFSCLVLFNWLCRLL